jgi:hypothetical protein
LSNSDKPKGSAQRTSFELTKADIRVLKKAGYIDSDIDDEFIMTRRYLEVFLKYIESCRDIDELALEHPRHVRPVEEDENHRRSLVYFTRLIKKIRGSIEATDQPMKRGLRCIK